jgi:hypothetical protein
MLAKMTTNGFKVIDTTVQHDGVIIAHVEYRNTSKISGAWLNREAGYEHLPLDTRIAYKDTCHLYGHGAVVSIAGFNSDGSFLFGHSSFGNLILE